VLNDSTGSQAMYVCFYGWIGKVHSGAEPYNVTRNFGNKKQVYLYRKVLKKNLQTTSKKLFKKYNFSLHTFRHIFKLYEIFVLYININLRWDP